VVVYRDADPSYPQSSPMLNTAFNQGAPVLDYIYQAAIIDGHGSYRLSGMRAEAISRSLRNISTWSRPSVPAVPSSKRC
jgi:hypothetical protein